MKVRWAVTQDQINTKLWAACDTFRGAFDSSEYKNYILVFMFLKYLSDVWEDKLEAVRREIGNQDELVKRKMSRERFVLPDGCTFMDLYRHRNDTDIGEQIDKALAKIEDQNLAKLEGVFRNISFNSEKLGQTKDRNRRLKNLLEDFAAGELNFRPSLWEKKHDVIGNAYMYLLERFASGAGKKGGEFYTPHEVSELLARLLAPKAGARICDPTCGSGSLLITVAEHVTDKSGQPSRDFALYGQDSNGDTWALAKMNMFLHEMDSADIEWGDTINNPKLKEDSGLMKFDVVVANPPFSLDKWGAEHADADPFKRFSRGVPPKSKGDYAFILHMIDTTLPTGRVGVIVPHGVLFRGGAEGRIREQLIRENLLDAVIGLPGNLFFGTGIPAAMLLFDKSRGERKDPGSGAGTSVLFIDASAHFEQGKKQNRLREEDIERVVKTYRDRAEVEKFSHVGTFEEIEQNEFNLNIPRYVDTFEEEAPVDIAATQQEIDRLEKELLEVRAKMDGYLKELGLLTK